MNECLPVAGVRLAAGACGLKANGAADLALIELAPEAETAAVFTRNAFCAAPVQVARSHLDEQRPRALLINYALALPFFLFVSVRETWYADLGPDVFKARLLLADLPFDIEPVFRDMVHHKGPARVMQFRPERTARGYVEVFARALDG